MSRYEKINYAELKRYAAAGGKENRGGLGPWVSFMTPMTIITIPFPDPVPVPEPQPITLITLVSINPEPSPEPDPEPEPEPEE